MIEVKAKLPPKKGARSSARAIGTDRTVVTNVSQQI